MSPKEHSQIGSILVFIISNMYHRPLSYHTFEDVLYKISIFNASYSTNEYCFKI